MVGPGGYPDVTALDSTPAMLANAAATATVRSDRMPAGDPSRVPFIIGGIGMLLLLIGGNGMWILEIFPYNSLVYTANLVVIGLGLTLAAFGFIGYRMNYHSSMGLVTALVTLIFAWWLPALYAAQGAFHGPGIYLWGALLITGMEMLGVSLILWGVTVTRVRHRAGHSRLGVAAGVLFILAGSFWCSILLVLVASIMLIPACIVGMVSLFMSRLGGGS